MRPLLLEFSGLFGYEKNQTVDFGTFDGRESLFISGSGQYLKTVLADVLIYSLFGRIENAYPDRFILNKQVGEANMRLTFEVEGKVYFIERTFKLIKDKKQADLEAVIFKIVGKQKKFVAAGIDAVDEFMSTILSANAETYKRAVVLNVYLSGDLLGLSDDAQQKYFKSAFGVLEFESQLKAKTQDKLLKLKVKKAQLEASIKAKTGVNLDNQKSLTALEERRLKLIDKIIELNKTITQLKSGSEQDNGQEELDDLPTPEKVSVLKAEVDQIEMQKEEVLSQICLAEADVQAAEIEREILEDKYLELQLDAQEKKDYAKQYVEKDKSDDDAKNDSDWEVERNRAGLVELIKRRNELIVKLSEATSDCEKTRQKLDELNFDDELGGDRVTEASIRQLIKYKSELDEKSAKLTKKLDEVQLRRETAVAEVEHLTQKIAAIKMEMEGIRGDIDHGGLYTMFNIEYQKFHDLAHDVGKVDTYNDALRMINKKQAIARDEIERDTLELDRAEATRLNAEKNLYKINAKTDISQKEREKVINVNYYVGVANNVRLGDFCPLCSNVVTNKNTKNYLPAIPIDMELNRLREDRIRAEEILANTVAVIAGFNANIMHMKRYLLDLDADEKFYNECINDILNREGFLSRQLLYEAFMMQKNKYDSLRHIFDRLSELGIDLETLSIELKGAEALLDAAQKEADIYAELVGENECALADVNNSYTCIMDKSDCLELEEVACRLAKLEKEYCEKQSVRDQIEKDIESCYNAEVKLLAQICPDEETYTDCLVNAATVKSLSLDEQKELSRVEKLLKAEERKLIIIEYELDQLKSQDTKNDAVKLSQINEQITKVETIARESQSGEYADYVADQNAKYVLSQAAEDVFELSDGRYTLSYEGGIRLRDKFYDNKFRTLSTLSDEDRLLIGGSIQAALSKAVTQNKLGILFVDGIDAQPEMANVTQKLIDTWNKKFATVAVFVKDASANAKNKLSVSNGVLSVS